MCQLDINFLFNEFFIILESRPIATERICDQFNDLRSDIVLLYELNQALSNCEFELQTLRHRLEAINPAKVRILNSILKPKFLS